MQIGLTQVNSDVYCVRPIVAGGYVTVEAKAIPLAADLICACKKKHSDCCCECDCDCKFPCEITCDDCGPENNNRIRPVEVGVTIGLFSIVKMFRPVNLCVCATGYCMPDECEEISPAFNDPCEFFDSLEFPTDLFNPPAKDCCCN